MGLGFRFAGVTLVKSPPPQPSVLGFDIQDLGFRV